MRSTGALSRAVYVDELGRRLPIEFWAGRILVCDPLGAPRVVLPAPFSALSQASSAARGRMRSPAPDTPTPGSYRGGQ